jgi:hypothetical protein
MSAEGAARRFDTTPHCAGPSGLRHTCYCPNHALMGVAISCRPFGPTNSRKRDNHSDFWAKPSEAKTSGRALVGLHPLQGAFDQIDRVPVVSHHRLLSSQPSGPQTRIGEPSVSQREKGERQSSRFSTGRAGFVSGQPLPKQIIVDRLASSVLQARALETTTLSMPTFDVAKNIDVRCNLAYRPTR